MTAKEKIQLIDKFVKFVEEFLEIEQLPEIKFVNDRQWASQLHSFGMYKNANKEIMVYLKNRNLADILRTIGHELVHHKQSELGMLDMTSGETGSEVENQANATAGVMMRDFGKRHEQIYESHTIKLGNLLKEIKRK
jgi:Zn-dependent peptidase ImmA (M78 family)